MSKKVLFRNIYSVGVIQAVNYIFPLITVPIVSRIIGPEKFGVINFASSFIAYFILFIGYGFDLTATRKIAQDPQNAENRNKVFNETLFSQFLLLLVSSILFILFLNLIPQLKEEKLVAIFTFSVCVGTVITQNWLFQAMQDLSKIAILNLVSKVIFTIIILSTIHQRKDYVWQPLAVSSATIFVGLISFTWSVKRYHLKLQRVSLASCLRTLREEMPYFLSMVVITLYTTTNTVILGLFRSAAEVGYYSAGQKLVAIFQSIISLTLVQSLFPYVGKAFGESHQKGLDLAQRMLPIVILITFVAGVVLFIAGPYILILFYGDSFRPSISVFKILAFTPVIISFSTIVGIHVMLNLKMDRLFFVTTCIGAVFSILCNCLFVTKFGFKASAYNLLFTELLVAVLFYLGLRRRGIEVVNRKYFHPQNITRQILSLRK
jgi:O-antigen/teichoic acid export membrane protein